MTSVNIRKLSFLKGGRGGHLSYQQRSLPRECSTEIGLLGQTCSPLVTFVVTSCSPHHICLRSHTGVWRLHPKYHRQPPSPVNQDSRPISQKTKENHAQKSLILTTSNKKKANSNPLRIFKEPKMTQEKHSQHLTTWPQLRHNFHPIV